jgi:predicted GNAT superfamily acetyltransferase
MKIRYAEEQDMDLLKEGLLKVRIIEKRPDPDIPVKDDDIKSFRKGIRERTIRVIDGDDGKSVAFLYYRTDHPIMYVSGDIFWIDLIYVKEEYRGSGYGKALYEDAVSIAEKMGLSKVVIDIFDQNDRSKIFHSQIGFKPFYTIYIKDV